MNQLCVAMYHYVRGLKDSRYPNIKGLDYELFKKQIDFFETNYNVVTMEDVIAAKHSSKQILPPNALLLTFDDGYIDHYLNVLPILKEHHMQGSFFVPAKVICENVLLDVNKIHFLLASVKEEELLRQLYKQLDSYRVEANIASNEELFQQYAIGNRFDKKETIFIKRMLQTVLPEQLRGIITSNLFEIFIDIPEKSFAQELYMNRDQVRCMRNNGMFIGLHGYDHYWLGNLVQTDMQQDISKALEVMDEFIDDKSWVMNYPYGSYNEKVISYIKQKGCQLGLTTEVSITEVNEDNAYKISRLDCNDFPPKSNNYINYAGKEKI